MGVSEYTISLHVARIRHRRNHPIQVSGETWRRLKVTFPEHIKSHTREQISCFGPDGLLRRQDYTVDILGGAPGLNYATDYREVDGIVIPTTRRTTPGRVTISSSQSRCWSPSTWARSSSADQPSRFNCMLRRNEALHLDLEAALFVSLPLAVMVLPNRIAMASTTRMRTAPVKRRHR